MLRRTQVLARHIFQLSFTQSQSRKLQQRNLNLINSCLVQTSLTKREIRKRKMSTFTLPDTDVEVKLVEGLSKDELLAFPAFKVSSSLSHLEARAESFPSISHIRYPVT